MQNDRVASRPISKSPPAAAGYRNFAFCILRFALCRPARRRGGYAALAMTLIVLAASLTVVGGLTFFSLQEVAVNRAYVKSLDSRVIAESGVEDALWRVLSGKQIGASETLGVGKGAATITVSAAGPVRTIRSAGARENFQQNVEARLDITATELSFVFGVLVGEGGLEMENNSTISGSVFSNGHIVGAGGATITGDAFAAGASRIEDVTIGGNAQANLIDDSAVGGYASSTTKLDDVVAGKDAHADELDDTTVTRDAYYNVIDGTSVVLGNRITPAAPPPNLAPAAFPVSASMIDAWKDDASANGVIASGSCSQDWSPPTSPYTVNGGVIEQNLKLDNNKVLVLKGVVWVKCNVDVANGGSLRLDASYGASSGVLVADGWMHFSNNGLLQGSGAPGSYLMLVTAASGGGHHGSAVDLHNNAAGALFYASNGLIYLHANATATQLTGRTVHLENNANLAYELGVSDLRFSSGPSGGYEVKYWKEVE